jgi:hypothetical protein
MISELLQIFNLLRCIEFGRLRLVAAERAVCPLIRNFVPPILKQDLEGESTLRPGTLPIKVPVVIDLKWH